LVILLMLGPQLLSDHLLSWWLQENHRSLSYNSVREYLEVANSCTIRKYWLPASRQYSNTLHQRTCMCRHDNLTSQMNNLISLWRTSLSTPLIKKKLEESRRSLQRILHIFVVSVARLKPKCTSRHALEPLKQKSGPQARGPEKTGLHYTPPIFFQGCWCQTRRPIQVTYHFTYGGSSLFPYCYTNNDNINCRVSGQART
jgi:hypothetical protein